MKKLISDFQNLSKAFLESINQFPDNQKENLLFDQWSLKDITAHIVGWHKLFLMNLKNLSTGKTPQDWKKIDDFNQKNVAAHQSSSFRLMYQELLDVDKRLVNQLKRLSPSEWDKKFWSDRNQTLPKNTYSSNQKSFRENIV